jgi:hypothetical protein
MGFILNISFNGEGSLSNWRVTIGEEGHDPLSPEVRAEGNPKDETKFWLFL